MKKISKHFIYLLMMCFLSLNALAQVKIGGDPNNIQPSSLLDVASSSKGFLPTRMTTEQRNNIIAPAEGLIIFNTTTNCLNYYVSPNWFESCGVITALPAALGSTFTSFTNGAPSNEIFSDNTLCQSKLISAGHSTANCFGTLKVGNNTYNVVLIHGQCWMQDNLKEAPTAPCSDDINTGCNIWLNTPEDDIGSWGYFNINGASGGWATTEPVASEGLLYQWSAAMNGSTTERAQGACPTGWHIPSDCEWMYLEHGQGMSIQQQNAFNTWRSTTGEGSKLSTFTLSGNNSSGFTALLLGFRSENGGFANRGSIGHWWTSSQASQTVAHRRHMRSTQPGVNRFTFNKANAHHVRCLKD